jgi:hypothetical protein
MRKRSNKQWISSNVSHFSIFYFIIFLFSSSSSYFTPYSINLLPTTCYCFSSGLFYLLFSLFRLLILLLRFNVPLFLVRFLTSNLMLLLLSLLRFPLLILPLLSLSLHLILINLLYLSLSPSPSPTT